MPLAAPIGSGLGIQNKYNIAFIKDAVKVPVIVDAGVGCASDAAIAMELGAEAVLTNTAIACAQNPIQMAEAMKYAVIAGRLGYKAGRIPKNLCNSKFSTGWFNSILIDFEEISEFVRFSSKTLDKVFII